MIDDQDRCESRYLTVNCILIGSGLLYLNEEFKGGDFYFTNENLSTQV